MENKIKRNAFGRLKYLSRILFAPFFALNDFARLTDSLLWNRTGVGRRLLRGQTYKTATAEIINLEFVNIISMIASALCGVAASIFIADWMTPQAEKIPDAEVFLVLATGFLPDLPAAQVSFALQQTIQVNGELQSVGDGRANTASVLFAVAIGILLLGFWYRRRWLKQVSGDAWEPGHDAQQALKLLNLFEENLIARSPRQLWPTVHRFATMGRPCLKALKYLGRGELLIYLFAMPVLLWAISELDISSSWRSVFQVMCLIYLVANISSLAVSLFTTAVLGGFEYQKVQARRSYLERHVIEDDTYEIVLIRQNLEEIKQMLINSQPDAGGSDTIRSAYPIGVR